MADFDPYHRWLGIAKGQRPPNHYQLLGVPVGEADAEVIEEAAVRQTAHVRTYQIGQHAADCMRILNEIGLAKTVLLNPLKKKEYDAKLMALSQPAVAQDDRIAAAPAIRAARPVAVSNLAEPQSGELDVGESPWISAPPTIARPIRRQAAWLSPGLIIGAAVGGTLVLGLIVLFVVLLSRKAGPDQALAQPGANEIAAKNRKPPVAKAAVVKEPVGKALDGPKGNPRVEVPADPPPINEAIGKNLNQLDTAGFAIEEDYVRVRHGMVCNTKQEYSGPLEITVIARTEKQNIRLHAFKGACVIFNWEGKMNELRVNRPDGKDFRESGSLTTAAVEPLAFNTWHTLVWRIDVEGMQIIANNKTVFHERWANNLADARKVGIGAMTHVVDVRYFDVKPLKRGLGEP